MNKRLLAGLLPIMVLTLFCTSQVTEAATAKKVVVKTTKKVTGKVLGQKEVFGIFSNSACYKDITTRKTEAFKQFDATRDMNINNANQAKLDCEAAVYNASQNLPLLSDRNAAKDQEAFEACALNGKQAMEAIMMDYHQKYQSLTAGFASEMKACVDTWLAGRRAQLVSAQTSSELTLAQRRKITLASVINSNCSKDPVAKMNDSIESAKLTKEAAVALAGQLRVMCEAEAMSNVTEEQKSDAKKLCAETEKAALAQADKAYKVAEAEANITANAMTQYCVRNWTTDFSKPIVLMSAWVNASTCVRDVTIKHDVALAAAKINAGDATSIAQTKKDCDAELYGRLQKVGLTAYERNLIYRGFDACAAEERRATQMMKDGYNKLVAEVERVFSIEMKSCIDSRKR